MVQFGADGLFHRFRKESQNDQPVLPALNTLII
jgi:hypothetical protein